MRERVQDTSLHCLLSTLRTPLRVRVEGKRGKEGREKRGKVEEGEAGNYFSSTNADSYILLASSPGHSQILFCSRGEKSGEGLGSLLRHGLKMVDMVSTN